MLHGKAVNWLHHPESSGWILRFYAGHSDFMVILLLNQMRSKGSVSKREE